MLGWHFLKNDRKLGYEDGRLITPGSVVKVDVPPVLCVSGLHANKRAIDALRYDVGKIVCRVDISGTVIQEDGKMVGSCRTVIWMADATDCLDQFARQCALDVIHMWSPRSPPEIVTQYLETGDKKIRMEATTAVQNIMGCSPVLAAEYAILGRPGAAAGFAAWSANYRTRLATRCEQDTKLTAMLSKLPKERASP